MSRRITRGWPAARSCSSAVGIAGIMLILVRQRWLPKVPAVLIMVVAATASTMVFSLAKSKPKPTWIVIAAPGDRRRHHRIRRAGGTPER